MGLGLEIEMRAVAQAMLSLPWFRQNEYLTINVSPDVVLDPEFSASFALTISPPDSLSRLVLEITEHSAINHYAEIAAVLDPFRRLGMRVAVDDVGAGYASFRHILNLSPDIIKIDMGITRGVDTDWSHRSLVKAILGFATATHIDVVAEGVETGAEMEVLRELGVRKIQGYLVGKPARLDVTAKNSVGTGVRLMAP